MSSSPQPRRSSRRQFLVGLSARDAVEDLADRLEQVDSPLPGDHAKWEELASPDSAVQPQYLLHLSRRAMACEFTVYLNAGQYPHGVELAMEALDVIDHWEDRLSVYREHSVISQINRQAAGQLTRVEADLLGLLELATQLHHETSGAFDITAGSLTQAWGFLQRQGRIPGAGELEEALATVGTDDMIIDRDGGTVTLLRAGATINLGGIGKGFALDRAADALLTAGVSDFVMHGGASSVLARGHRGLRSPCAWQVDVRHPFRPGALLAKLHLHNQCVGTSGSRFQSFHHQGRRLGHILDPRTGQPAEQVLSSTVVATSAAMADALATAFYVMGVEATAAYCERHPEVGAVLIRDDEQAGQVQIDVYNLNDDVLQMLAQPGSP